MAGHYVLLLRAHKAIGEHLLEAPYCLSLWGFYLHLQR